MQVIAIPNYEKEGLKITALFEIKEDDFGKEYHLFFGELSPSINIQSKQIIDINKECPFEHRKGKWYVYPLKCPCCGQPIYNKKALIYEAGADPV